MDIGGFRSQHHQQSISNIHSNNSGELNYESGRRKHPERYMTSLSRKRAVTNM